MTVFVKLVGTGLRNQSWYHDSTSRTSYPELYPSSYRSNHSYLTIRFILYCRYTLLLHRSLERCRFLMGAKELIQAPSSTNRKFIELNSFKFLYLNHMDRFIRHMTVQTFEFDIVNMQVQNWTVFWVPWWYKSKIGVFWSTFRDWYLTFNQSRKVVCHIFVFLRKLSKWDRV